MRFVKGRKYLTKTMKFFCSILFSFLSFGIVLSQNESQINYAELLLALKKDIKNGQHRTIRDLISLIDHESAVTQARKILKDHTFFTSTEINVSKASKSALLDFYYDREKEIKYSEILNAFYITPVEQYDISFELKNNEHNQSDQTNGTLRRLLTDLNSHLEHKKFTEAEQVIQQIIQLKCIDQEVYLNILKDPRLLDFPEKSRNNNYESLMSSLENYLDVEVIEIAAQMLDGAYLKETFVIPFLTTITNNSPDTETDIESSAEYFLFLIDSLGSLDEIRTYGYEKIFKSRISFFQFPVDYYGKILTLSDQYSKLKQNIIFDLQHCQHPRAFFYIASDLYRSLKEDKNFDSNYHMEVLQYMTNVKIGVKDANDKITFDPLKDETSTLNYFLFWASHYGDFEWDENRQLFTNKMETLAKTQNYERLFRRLNSRNDTIALESFVQLTEGEPLEIKSLAKKYRQLLRNQNKTLPSLKYKYLEQLSLLTEYCRQNKIEYKVQPTLAKKLSALLHAKNQKERYAIENIIINEIKIDEITAFEYWACLKEGSKDISFSAGRILDWVYSKYWDNILTNKDQLRLFLKKSYLFENISVSGVCNAYLNKFNRLDPKEYQALEEIGKIESDEDILTQISLLLAIDIEESLGSYSILDFLDDPLVFNRRDIKILPKPTEDDVKKIVSIIKTEPENEVIRNLFFYLWLHPDIEYIPYLFELIDDDRIVTQKENLTVSVADNIIPIVENVYSHSFEVAPKKLFATEQWRTLWRNEGEHFKKWEQKFFEQKLDSLKYFTQLKIEDLNELTESSFYSIKYKDDILKNINKIKPIRNIRKLSIEPKLSVDEDLKYFKQFFFSYKELDEIPKLFNIKDKDVVTMLSFINEKTTSFEISEKGSLYNNLLRAPWLSRAINQGKLKSEATTIIEKILIKYLNESEFLSEFEEQITQLNIAQLQFMGKSIPEKIDATLALDADKGSKAKILKSIIATVTYEEIGLVVSRFDQMEDILEEKTYTFLSRDFGIPVFSFDTSKEQELFIENHSKMSEFAFYEYYLKKFGIDLSKKKRQLDYQQIYNILHFDIVSPFVGETGGKRDLYIYSIIKLLELQFDTQLGFHRKLNESQTFYSFSSTKRAQAWLKYLEDKKLINTNNTFPRSFNFSKDME